MFSDSQMPGKVSAYANEDFYIDFFGKCLKITVGCGLKKE